MEQRAFDKRVLHVNDVFGLYDVEPEAHHVLHDEDVDHPHHVDPQVKVNVFHLVLPEAQDQLFFEHEDDIELRHDNFDDLQKLEQEDLVFVPQHLLQVPFADTQPLNVVHHDNLDVDTVYKLRLLEDLQHFQVQLFEDDFIGMHHVVYKASSPAACLVHRMQHKDMDIDVDLQAHHHLDRAACHQTDHLQHVNATSNNDWQQENDPIACHDVKHLQDIINGQAPQLVLPALVQELLDVDSLDHQLLLDHLANHGTDPICVSVELYVVQHDHVDDEVPIFKDHGHQHQVHQQVSVLDLLAKSRHFIACGCCDRDERRQPLNSERLHRHGFGGRCRCDGILG